MKLLSRILNSIRETKKYYDYDGLLKRESIVSKKEKELLQKERELLQKEESMLSAEDALKKREEEIRKQERELKEIEEQVLHISKNIEDEINRRVNPKERELLAEINDKAEKLSELESALCRTEIRVFDYVKRKEKQDIDAFNEILTEAKKFKEFSKSLPSTGYDFEEYVASILKDNGYQEVIVTKKSGDFGADITAVKDEVVYVIQCKYYTSSVGIDAVQQVMGAKELYKAHVAVVATNSVFTKAAKILAEEARVILWDCEDLTEMKH